MALRIVLDVRHYRDFGIGTYIRNLTSALSHIDAVNHYILTAKPGDVDEFAGLSSNFEIVPYERSAEAAWDHVAYPYFVKRFAPDLTHIPLNQVPMGMRKPYVVTLHDLSSLIFGKREQAGESFRLFRFRRGLMRADCVIAVSEATQRDAEHLLGIPHERMRIVHSAPDPRFFNPIDPEFAHSVLERYQIRYPFLLYAGRISPQKNIPRLIEAFAVLRAELESHPVFKELRLIIIGDKISEHPEVRRTTIQTRTEHAVRFLGFVPFETLQVFYAQAAAFVFPSLYEGFGLPPLEAMAAGTPVITSNVSSLPEVVADAAEIVNPDNVFDIARGMREVLLDDTRRTELIRQGHEHLKKFDWRRTALEVLDVYREVAS